ncbi:CRAL/TRIO domain-containing protein [Gigaspora margarita]|uniref:CRAL/TRIO domain-containing protein n=1 Tax=Gigaspora margarita TaxID=4874 RepID=A0A8H4ARP7_GIGMA|nr:CRAL/TRIO domain-containing protein [Gigaspora margarita]
MSTAIALQQQLEDPTSGHVNTLTKEQASLLRDCWAVTFILQGITTDDIPEIKQNNANVSSNSTVNGRHGKKNKEQNVIETFSKYSKMARKMREDKSASNASRTASNGSSRSNDKYNESSEFLSALVLYTPEELHRAAWKVIAADDPDVILLRFLRARKWDVEKAIIMYISTLKWMLQTNVRDIVEGGEEGLENYFAGKDLEGLKHQFTSGKSFARGTDKDGRPVCYVNVRYHKKDEQSFEVLQKYTIYIMETTRLMMEAPVETGCLVFNMAGFTMSNMDFQYVKFIIQCFESYYPESLGILIIHKAPWVFGGLWKMISPLLDPVVASKVRFTQNEKEILQLIPSKHLIADLGGEDNWKYKYVPPKENENYRMKDEVTKKQMLEKRHSLERDFEKLTKQWLSEPDNEQIKNERNQMKIQLRKAQLELDPYIRARTYYDRIGVLREDGSCDWGLGQ